MPRKAPRRRSAPRDVTPASCLVDAHTGPPEGFRRSRPVHKGLLGKKDPMFDLMGEVRLFVEVGSQWGWFAYRAAKNLPDAVIYCVDPWWEDRASAVAWSGEHNFWEWQLNISEWLGKRVFGLRGTSEEVVNFFEDGTLDAVFIDADHSTVGVLKDLRLWVPKVRTGGTIFGHDWDGIWGKHVRPAVNGYFSGTGWKNSHSGEPLPHLVVEPGYCGKKGERISPVWRVVKTWQ